MRFDLRTIALVHRRLRHKVRHPLLFNDHMTPARVSLRMQRFKRWCGPGLWLALCEYEQRGELPTGGRHWFRKSPPPGYQQRVQSASGWAQ